MTEDEEEIGLVAMCLTITFKAYPNSFDSTDHNRICSDTKRQVNANCAVKFGSAEATLKMQSE